MSGDDHIGATVLPNDNGHLCTCPCGWTGQFPNPLPLDELNEAFAAHIAADTEPVYPGGGLAFTKLQPAAGDQRAALAELANDSQNMGTYDGWPVAGVADFLARDRDQRQVPCSKPAGHDGPHTRHHRTGGEG